MGAKAYVLIEVAVAKTTVKEVIGALDKVKGVTSVEAVTGPYDVIAVVEARDVNALGDLVTAHVHTISGIDRTVTCLAMTLA
ncbi:MAG: Lrp/AsnC ligand binding domain-containing protein [Chloroflexota bacterium]|nr:Lrp/AsnC ligand binding domain-containing protein [Chloroflexota bacterium]